MNDFFEVLYILNKERKTDKNLLSDNIKIIVQNFKNRKIYEGFSNDFSHLQELFNKIKDENSDIINSFSNSFINILIQEIKKENIKSQQDLNKILEYALDPSNKMNNCCIPLIHEIFQDKFFSDLKDNEKNNIKDFDIYKNTSLNTIDGKIGNSQELKEKILFYFENNINIIFDEFYSDKLFKDNYIREYLKQSLSFLENDEKNNNKDKKNINLFLLFIIAFLKIFLKKYISSVEVDLNNKEDQLSDIFSENENLFYYIIKLHLDNRGDYYDTLKSDLLFKLPDNMEKKFVNNTKKKYFGFDYLFLPLDKNYAKKYNDIIKTIDFHNLKQSLENDNGIVEDLNKNGVDVFYCVITNLFLSKFKMQDYKNKDEYKLFFNWLNLKLNENEFKILNKYSKNILLSYINEKEMAINNNQQLIIVLFALRIVLNKLSSKNDNQFFKNLVINPNETISKNKDIFDIYFNGNEDSNKYDIRNKTDKESFAIKKFMILSHLLFSCLLNKKAIIINNIEYDDKILCKSLYNEYEFIIKLMRYKGIKYKYNIIFNNILFNEIKLGKYNDMKIKTYQGYNDNYTNKFTEYFDILKEIKMTDIDMEMNETKKIIFEDSDYYKKNIQKDLYFKYLTTPNIYSKEDFIYQYHLSGKNYPIIEFTINKEIDEIMNIMSCLPEINEIINDVYYKKVLTINREQLKEERVNVKCERFKKNINKLKNYLNIDINGDLSNNTDLSNFINFKDNYINKMYEDIIKKYNNILLKITMNKDNKNFMKKLIIQDFSKNCFGLEESEEEDENENQNEKNPVYKRLIELITLYSERNRFKTDELNVIDGDKITYNFDLIEKQLEKEIISGKPLLKDEQRTFIFCNEVFSGERNNILSELMKKYPQEKAEKDTINLDNIESTEIINTIYHNLQFIIIYLVQYYNIESDEESKTLSLNTLIDIIKEEVGFKVDHNFPTCDNIYLKNILSLYEKIEEKYFELNKNDIKPKNIENKKKEEIDNYFNNNNLLIKKDTISNIVKKYYLRYCLGDYEKEEDKLKNMDMNKFKKEDLWRFTENKKEYEKEFEDLRKLNGDNNNYLINYLLVDIFNLNEEEEEKEDNNEKKPNGDDSDNENDSQKDNNNDKGEDSESNDKEDHNSNQDEDDDKGDNKSNKGEDEDNDDGSEEDEKNKEDDDENEDE